MEFTWDINKSKKNIEKHGISFSEVEPVFFDPYAIEVKDEITDGEQRFAAIGMDALFRIIVVVYAYRDDSIRIISARKAEKSERKDYEKGIRF